MKVVTLNLPLPPSANSIWRTTKSGRTYLNPKYRDWRKAATTSLWTQKPVGGFPKFEGAFEVQVIVAHKMLGDIDNRLKPALDFLASSNIIANDKHAQRATIARSEDVAKGMCRVFVFEARAA